MHKLISCSVFFLLVTFAESVSCQTSAWNSDPILIQLRARIISAGDSMAVPYASVVNKRNRSGTSSNAGGFFSMEILNIDTLNISAVGFKNKLLKIPQNYSESDILTIYLEPVVYSINEVKVTGDKAIRIDGIPYGKQSPIPKELRGDAFNEKPPLIAAFFNPMSYWQYYLSKKEKQKREVREAIALQKNWEMHSRNYNKEMVRMLTGLNEADADTFMIWFNAQKVLPYTSSEYEVRSAIKNWFEVYKKQRLLR